MTPLMKGFLLGTAAVAVALLFGFGGGILIADWLDDAPKKQTRIEKVKGTDGKGSPAVVTSATNENPKRQEPRLAEENPLVPKKVTTEPLSTPAAPAQVMAGPTVSASAEVDDSKPAKVQTEQKQPVRSQQLEAKRQLETDSRSVKPERKSRGANKSRNANQERKKAAKRERRELAETTGSAGRQDDNAFDQEDRPTRRSVEKRNVSGSGSDEGRVKEARHGTAIRPLFGLFAH